MQVPSTDPSKYCRLCFSQQHIKCELQFYQNPLVNQITECLGLWLSEEDDFPCSICRVCVASLEIFQAFRERSNDCDLALRKSRMNLVDKVTIPVDAIKQESPCSIDDEGQLLVDEELILGSTSPPPLVEGNDGIDSNVSIKLEPSAASSTVQMPSKRHLKIRVVPADDRRLKKRTVSKRMFEAPTYTCEKCNNTFAFKGMLAKHTCKSEVSSSEKHKVGKVPPVRLRPSNVVVISPKELRKQWNLYSGPSMSTTVSHHSKFYCSICHTTSPSAAAYFKHQQSHGNAGTAAPIERSSS
ncbi:uncharacterized protein LOC128732589 [Sabethes cyaneus]|uniref:uncharacterized protein LOC128732589 n=1 Tax=Sabethes cyaneus TaxID=53552 RepID=UPI00237D4DDC|nr:uncharacterized protein LOC128732589 [Sabethes cyaneus]